MAETLTYPGFVETKSWGNPVLARALNEEARERAKRENSGGVIFPTEEEMPSLTELLAKGEIKSAFLVEQTSPDADEAPVTVAFPTGDWRAEARNRLTYNVEIADRAAVMEEDYVFLAALSGDDLDLFLDRAHAVLADESTSEDLWQSFLVEASERTFGESAHEPIALVKNDHPDDDEPNWQPLISLDSLEVPFTRGALGGPRPLADLREA